MVLSFDNLNTEELEHMWSQMLMIVDENEKTLLNNEFLSLEREYQSEIDLVRLTEQ